MPAPPEIVRLVDTFRSNEPGYTDPRYVELQTRINFIDPFFRELGWDVSNARGLPPDQAEVFFEDTIRREAGHTASMDPMAGKRPDYSFRVDGKRKFYVEAKKPAEDLEHNVAHAYQVRAYGWSSKLPVSVLTDFQQLAVYDCRVKPERADPASVARLDNFYITYDQYADRWDDIARLLSREAVMAGSLDKFAESKPPRGALTVDAAFLKDISEWRRLLAVDIAHRNPRMSQYELNYAVQMTINRIIFLRICEDRGIERPEALKASLVESKVVDGANSTVAQGYAYRELVRQFQRADGLYNSGLFHFSDERGRHEHADTFTLDMQVGDDVLARIIEHLYYPYPYKFDVIPIEILGQVYEQFLGEVIVLGAGEDGATASLDAQHSVLSPPSLSLPARTVTVEQKPEVRKAGGVYYTPTYIVDYIVAHTVGRLLEGKTVEEATRLRIVDPACGSGSFLIGAYSYLLDWHLRYYLANDPETLSKKRKDRPVERVTVTAMGEHGPVEETTYRLTRAERKRILLDNIYGVDIDTQAVEVTKLSLLLKVLEGEAAQSGQIGLAVDERRILPDLGSNIKCGNSLIGPDFYASGQATFLDEQEERRINVFDWQDAFPEIMLAGGFDAVIGNPPYARIQTLQESQSQAVDYFKNRYKTANKGNFDIYVLFLEKGYSLLRLGGLLGYILPHKFLQAQFAKPLRETIAGEKSIVELVHFGAEQVFQDASTYTCLLFLSKRHNEKFRFVSVQKLEAPEFLLSTISVGGHSLNYVEATVNQPTSGTEWNFTIGGKDKILERLRTQPLVLGDVVKKIAVGLQTSADKIFVLSVLKWNTDTVRCYSKSLMQELELERGIVKPFLFGKDVHRYQEVQASSIVISPYTISKDKAQLLPQDMLKREYPLCWEYLLANKPALVKREGGKFQDTWWQFGRPQNLSEFEIPRIVTPEISLGCNMTYTTAGIYHTTKVYSILMSPDQVEQSSYWLGILNSKLLWLFLSSTGYVLRGGYFVFKTEYLKPFPIRTIDFTSPADKARHDRMVQLVEGMLMLHKQLTAAHTPHDKDRYERLIKSTDHEIDNLVYELYGLTPEEVAIVEGGA